MTTKQPVAVQVAEPVYIRWLAVDRGECRRAEIIVPDNWPSLDLFAKGDEQLGHVCCDEERVLKDIEWVRKRPYTLVVLLGDAIDSATKESPGSQYENKWPPYEQLCKYAEIHQPIKDRIVGLVTGNHERRIDKVLGGGASASLLAEKLSSPAHRIPYSSGILLLDVLWRSHLWTFTLFHGAGAAQTAGAKVQRQQRNMLLTDSLITLSGHLHDESKTSRRFTKRTPDGGYRTTKQTSLQCGTYLKWVGSYGEIGGMPPTGPDMVLISFHPDGNYTDQFKGEGETLRPADDLAA